MDLRDPVKRKENDQYGLHAGAVPVDERFGLLPDAEGRGTRFATSAVVNAIVFAIAIVLAAAAVKHHEEQKYVSTQLVLPEEAPPPPPKPKVLPKPPKVPPPTPKPPEPPKVEPPKPVIVRTPDPPKPVQAPPAPPKIERVAPPPPKVGLFETPKATAVANNNKPPTIKTGGFGDPSGVKPNPTANKPANIAAVGGFDMPKGDAVGAGSAGKGSVHGVAFGTGPAYGKPGGTGTGKVNIAGFANGVQGGVPGGTGTGRGGSVKSGGFGTGIGQPTGPVTRGNDIPASTAPVVLYKPDAKAFYTADARAAHVEGDVVVKIRVDASGHAEFLGIVRGLGHGLDEAAQRIVSQTRFKPAMSNGQPVEVVTNMRITFESA